MSRNTAPTAWCKAAGCGRGTNDKPFCIKHLSLMPYPAKIAAYMLDGTAVEADRLITALRARGAQSARKFRQEVVDLLVAQGIVKVVEVGSRRGNVRKVVMFA